MSFIPEDVANQALQATQNAFGGVSQRFNASEFGSLSFAGGTASIIGTLAREGSALVNNIQHKPEGHSR